MQRNVRVCFLATLLCAVSVVSIVSAQQPLRDTPSHRFIPPGNKPTSSDFRTPEYESAQQAYRELRRARSTRLNTQQRNDGISPNSPFDTENTDQLAPETQELLREWSKNSVAGVSEQIGREIVEFNQRFRQSSGIPDAKDKPISFDFSRDVLQQYEDAKKNWSEQRSALNSRYREALSEYRDKWPSEKIPPEQWLTKVQPFINSEVLDQLSKIRDFQDGKTTQLPELPKELLPATPPSSLGKRVLQSVVKSFDQGGSELIKQAQRNKQGKKQTSWWKRLKSKTNSQVKSLNKSITDRTERYASATTSSAVARTGAAGTPLSAPKSGKWFGQSVCAIVLIAAAGYAVFRWRENRKSDLEELRNLIAPGLIQDRDSLLQAVHNLAATRFGNDSRFWHHRKLFAKFNATASASPVDTLYERVRYAPGGSTLTSNDLELVQRWYEHVRAKGAASS